MRISIPSFHYFVFALLILVQSNAETFSQQNQPFMFAQFAVKCEKTIDKLIQEFEYSAEKIVTIKGFLRVIKQVESINLCEDKESQIIRRLEKAFDQQISDQKIIVEGQWSSIYFLNVLTSIIEDIPQINTIHLDQMIQNQNKRRFSQQKLLTYSALSSLLKNLSNSIKHKSKKIQPRLLQVQIIEQKNAQNTVDTQTQTTVTSVTNSGNTTQSTTVRTTDNTQQKANNNSVNVNRNGNVPASIPSLNQFLRGNNFGNFFGNLGGQFLQTSTNSVSRSSTTQRNRQVQIKNQSTVTRENTQSAIRNQSNILQETTVTNKKPIIPPGFSNLSNVTVQSKQIFNREFNGLNFYHDIPVNFLQGQYFNFRGRITNNLNPTVKVPVNIVFRRKSNSESFSCTQLLDPGQKQFDFLCFVELSGEFYLSAFSGTQGQASQQIRNIKTGPNRNIPQVDQPDPVTGLSYQFINNEITFKWDSRQPITKLLFSQTNQNKLYLLSNYKNFLKIDLKQFQQFQANEPTILTIEQASSQSQSAYEQNSEFSKPFEFKFYALQNQFTEHDNVNLQINQLPWVVPQGTIVRFTGRARVPLKNQLILLSPEKQFISLQLVKGGSKQLQPGVAFDFEYKLQRQGNYIVEINNANGKALLNRPIYVYTQKNQGPGIPIVPDFQSRRQTVKSMDEILKVQPKSAEGKSKIMLDLINEKRKQYGVPQVYLDEQLSKLAQNYAIDMVRRGFQGHVNPEGQNPTDRARKAGITTNIGENLAMNPNITDAHYRLSRSSIHLKNMVNPQWKRVGLGFAQYPSGSFRIVQQFSDEGKEAKRNIGEAELNQIKNKVIQVIIRQNQNVERENRLLSIILKSWQNSSRNQSLETLLKNYGFNSYNYSSLKMTFSDRIAQKIEEKNAFKGKGGEKTQVGVSVKMLDNEQVEIYVVFV